MTLSESRPVKGIKEYFKDVQIETFPIVLLQHYLVPEAEKK